MAGVPQTFTVSSPIQVNYSYVDIASGTGTVVYYGYDSIDDTTKDYHLNSNIVFSQNVDSSQGFNNTVIAAEKVQDLDLDLTEYNIAQTIRGTATIVIPFGINSNGQGLAYTYYIVKVVHYDGSTETVLGSSQTNTLSAVGAGITADLATLKIDLTEKLFGVGDTLRVIVEGWGWCDNFNASDPIVAFAHDPKDRDTGTYITDANGAESRILEVHIPYKIEI